MSKSRLYLVANAAALITSVSAGGQTFDVVEGVVQASEADSIAAATDLAPHGFVLESRADTEHTPPPAVELKAEHRSQGRYAVMRGDEKLLEGLDKEQAAEFNALSPEDREKALEYALAAV